MTSAPELEPDRPDRLDRLTRKRVVSVLVAVPVLLLLLATTRTWFSGRSADPLLGGGAVSATGTQVAPGVAALALVGLVALVTTLTGGPLVRRVSAVVMVLAGVGSVLLTLGALRDPQTALGRVAATALGRTGVVSTTAEVSGWAWLALTAAAVLVLSSALAVVAAGRWGGLSRRFDAPSEEGGPASGGAAGRAGSPADARTNAWDELSAGTDPTVLEARDRPGPAARDDTSST